MRTNKRKRITFKLLQKGLISILIIFAFNTSFSQQNNTVLSSDRYIVINDLNSFFILNDKNITCTPFYIHNIFKNESSKPLHININSIKDVMKFSIKSNSEIYENQRECNLILKKENYQETLRIALIKMGIKIVICEGQTLSVDEFYNRIK
jgi:hypothetical protein